MYTPKNWQAKVEIDGLTYFAFHVILLSGRRRTYAATPEIARTKVERKMPSNDKVLKVLPAPSLLQIEGCVPSA